MLIVQFLLKRYAYVSSRTALCASVNSPVAPSIDTRELCKKAERILGLFSTPDGTSWKNHAPDFILC